MSVELHSEQEIRVQCVEHAIGFSVPRLSRRIVCEQGKEELDPDFPNHTFWDYCCDCEIFRPSDALQEKEAEGVCPLCTSKLIPSLSNHVNVPTRAIERRFLCRFCKVMTVESSEVSESRLFTLVTNGVPTLCPGCLKPDRNFIVEHDCYSPLMLVSYKTSREKCPFCSEQIAVLTEDRTGHGSQALNRNATEGIPTSGFRFTVLESFAQSDGHFSRLKTCLLQSESIWGRWLSHSGNVASIFGILLACVGLFIALLPPSRRFITWNVGWLFNHAPLVEQIESDQSVEEGRELLLKAHAQDADKEQLKFIWTTLPKGQGRIQTTNEDGSEAIFYADGIHAVSEHPARIIIGLTVSDRYLNVLRQQEIFVTARPNHPPVLTEPPSCNCQITEVHAGETISLQALAEDKEKDDIPTYQWQSSIPVVKITDLKAARGSKVTVDTSGLNPQDTAIPLKIFLTVSDGHSTPLLNDITIMVLPRQVSGKSGESGGRAQQTNHAPRFERFSLSKNLVDEGESVELRAEAIDPDGNLPLYYDWTTTAGAIQYNRGTAILNTSGVSSSDVEVTLIVTDGVGGRTSLRTTITVRPRPNKSPSSSPSPPTVREGAPSPKT
jgi:hypothetical protein